MMAAPANSAAQGKVDLAPAAGPALDITASLSRFTAARGDDLTATVDGKLQVTGALSAPRVTADITMPRADINIPDQLPSSVPQLDVIRIDSSKPAASRKPAAFPAPPVTAGLDIHFHAPGQTFVRGRGLTSEWSGDLTVTGTSAEPVIIGEFDVVNGTFDALGKSFVLQRGVLRFDGSTLPLLDMLAQVQAADVTAQIVIQGSPSRPEIKLTSTPELPQDEVLSRVMFGSGVGQITPAQGLQLAQAAATLAGGGPSMLDRLRNYTGLDRLLGRRQHQCHRCHSRGYHRQRAANMWHPASSSASTRASPARVDPGQGRDRADPEHHPQRHGGRRFRRQQHQGRSTSWIIDG